MKARDGFTLIELMVVVAIIALLMAILMPALGRASRQAKAVTCQVRLKHWGLCYKLYADENNGDFTPGTHADVEGGGAWFRALRKYYGDDWDLLVCPTATVAVEDWRDFGTFKAWETNYGGMDLIGSYCENAWIGSLEFYVSEPADRPRENYWVKVGNVRNPNLVPVLGDGTHFDAWPKHDDDPPEFPETRTGNISIPNMQHYCINRHDGFINMLFADWTVRKLGLKELWMLKWHRRWELHPETGVFDPSPWVRRGEYEPDWEGRAPWLSRFKDY